MLLCYLYIIHLKCGSKMTLSIQFLEHPEGFTRLEEEPVKIISSASKVFELLEPMIKNTTHMNGEKSSSYIYFLRLDETDVLGIYNVSAYDPDNKNLKLTLGLADVRKYSDPYLFN